MNTGGATVNRGEIVSMYAGLYSHMAVSRDSATVRASLVMHRFLGNAIENF